MDININIIGDMWDPQSVCLFIHNYIIGIWGHMEESVDLSVCQTYIFKLLIALIWYLQLWRDIHVVDQLFM